MRIKKNEKQKEEKQEGVSKDEYLYVYGIMNNTDIELDIKGLNDKPIQKLCFNDIAVLFNFYPNLHPVVEEKEAMLHAEILNKITNIITIIPMAFGTVFKNQEILKTVLGKVYQDVKKTLEVIKDKIELGIKVVKNGMEEIPEDVSKKISDELRQLSVKSVAGEMFSERLLLNHSFLVERNKFAQFSDKVGELEKQHQSVKFLYTGPWPAYSFVNIKIRGG